VKLQSKATSKLKTHLQARLRLLVIGLIFVTTKLCAQFQSDTFSGTNIDSFKWAGPVISGNGALLQNDALYYFNGGNGTPDDEANLHSNDVGPVDNDWSVWLDARIPNLAQISDDGDQVSLTLKVWDMANYSNRFDIEVFVQRSDPYGTFRIIGADLTTNNWATSDSSSVMLDLSAQSTISMAVSWQAGTKTFSTFYAPNGGGNNWIQLASWNLGPGSPTAWDLDPGQGFGLYIGGGSENVNLQTNDNVRITYFGATSGILTGRVRPVITTGGPGGGGDDLVSLPGAGLGNSYNFLLEATNGVAPYVWSVVALGGTGLPPGLNLSTNGIITGLPTQEGTWFFRVRVTGADGAYSEKNFIITVTLRPQLKLTRQSSNVILTWPTNSSGFTLKSATNLVSPVAWTTASPAPVIVNGQNTVTNPAGGTRKYYRLEK